MLWFALGWVTLLVSISIGERLDDTDFRAINLGAIVLFGAAIIGQVTS
jgi:hypothetical protein